MYKYKVISCSIDELEDTLNTLAKDGWKVVSVNIDQDALYGAVAVLEKELNPDAAYKN